MAAASPSSNGPLRGWMTPVAPRQPTKLLPRRLRRIDVAEASLCATLPGEGDGIPAEVATTIEDAEKLKRFHTFANSEREDDSLVFVAHVL